MKKREVCAARSPRERQIGELKCRIEAEYLWPPQTPQHLMEVKVNYLDQGVSDPSEDQKYCKSPQRLAQVVRIPQEYHQSYPTIRAPDGDNLTVCPVKGPTARILEFDAEYRLNLYYPRGFVREK